MLKGTHHDAAAREKIARRTADALARKRARERIAPSEVLEVQRSGTIARQHSTYAVQAAQEPHDVAQDLGGVDACSAQQRILLADLGRTGLVLRVLVARFLQGVGDPELASKIGSLVGQRRSTLQALGLERRAKDALDVDGYTRALAAHSGAGATNGARASVGDRPAETTAPEGEA